MLPSLLALDTVFSLPEERRLKFRYPLDLSVRFRCHSGSRFCGAGRAVNVSSGGLLMVFRQIVPQGEIIVGARVDLSIEWPSLLNGTTPLQLCAVGRVVRQKASGFAASFERYQFRTAGNSVLSNLNLE